MTKNKIKIEDIKTGDFFLTSEEYAQKGDIRSVINSDISHIINSRRGDYKIGKLGTRKRVIANAFKEEFNMSFVNIEDAREATIHRFKIIK